MNFFRVKAYDRYDDIIGRDKESYGFHNSVGMYLFGYPALLVLFGLFLWFGTDFAHQLQCIPDPNLKGEEICSAGYIQQAVYGKGIALAAWAASVIIFPRAFINVKRNWREWASIDCYCFSCNEKRISENTEK